jgi:hypothetical protein
LLTNSAGNTYAINYCLCELAASRALLPWYANISATHSQKLSVSAAKNVVELRDVSGFAGTADVAYIKPMRIVTR